MRENDSDSGDGWQQPEYVNPWAPREEDDAARASGPLGRCTTRAVGLAAALLPPASRERYIEEWKSDLYHTPTRLRRARFVPSMLAGAARLAVVLRQPASRSRP